MELFTSGDAIIEDYRSMAAATTTRRATILVLSLLASLLRTGPDPDPLVPFSPELFPPTALFWEDVTLLVPGTPAGLLPGEVPELLMGPMPPPPETEPLADELAPFPIEAEPLADELAPFPVEAEQLADELAPFPVEAEHLADELAPFPVEAEPLVDSLAPFAAWTGPL